MLLLHDPAPVGPSVAPSGHDYAASAPDAPDQAERAHGALSPTNDWQAPAEHGRKSNLNISDAASELLSGPGAGPAAAAE